MNVSALTTAVEGALERLRNRLSTVNSGPAIPTELQDAILEHELSKDIREVLEVQEEFAGPIMVNSLTGSSGFHSQFVAPLLLREARRRMSADAAVRWLEKVLATKSGAGIAVGTF